MGRPGIDGLVNQFGKDVQMVLVEQIAQESQEDAEDGFGNESYDPFGELNGDGLEFDDEEPVVFYYPFRGEELADKDDTGD